MDQDRSRNGPGDLTVDFGSTQPSRQVGFSGRLGIGGVTFIRRFSRPSDGTTFRSSQIAVRPHDDYLAERRAAVAKWASYLDQVLAGEIREVGQREKNVVAIGRAAT
jgi:hypothetical protein